MKKGVLRNFTKFTGKHLARVSFSIKLRPSGPQLYLKRNTGAGVFCEFCEISKNTFSTEHLWTTASIIIWIFTDICIVIVNTNFVAQRHI